MEHYHWRKFLVGLAFNQNMRQLDVFVEVFIFIRDNGLYFIGNAKWFFWLVYLLLAFTNEVIYKNFFIFLDVLYCINSRNVIRCIFCVSILSGIWVVGVIDKRYHSLKTKLVVVCKLVILQNIFYLKDWKLWNLLILVCIWSKYFLRRNFVWKPSVKITKPQSFDSF